MSDMVGRKVRLEVQNGKKPETVTGTVDQWNDAYCVLILYGGLPRKIFLKYVHKHEIIE